MVRSSYILLEEQLTRDLLMIGEMSEGSFITVQMSSKCFSGLGG